jgi:hypothetical protein
VNERVVDDLIESSEALIAALDSHDVETIEATLPLFGRSVEAIKAVGGWESSPTVRARLEQALQLADNARARVRYMVDRTQQRIDLLAVAAGRFDCTPATYSRPGR